jgi:hypothetical protein
MDLTTVDRDLDALGAGLDILGAASAALRRAGESIAQAEALDAELARLGAELNLPPLPEIPRRPARVAPAPSFSDDEASTSAFVPVVVAASEPAPASPPEAAPGGTQGSPSAAPTTTFDVAPTRTLGAEAAPTTTFDAAPTRALERVEPAPAEGGAGVAAAGAIAPASDDLGFDADALFADAFPAEAAAAPEVALADPTLGDDDGPRISVPDDLAALLEGELDPSEFGPPRPSRPAEISLADALEGDSGTSPSLPPKAVEEAFAAAAPGSAGHVHVDATVDPDAFGDDEPATSVANLADFFAAEALRVADARTSHAPPSPLDTPDGRAHALGDAFDDATAYTPRGGLGAGALDADAAPAEEEIVLEDGELEMFVEDDELAEVASAAEHSSQAPAGSPSQSPPDGKKGLFKKIFGG